MKHKKEITYLVIGIVVLALFSAIVGLVSNKGIGSHEIETFRGEMVTLRGKGLYQDDSVSVASQGIAQDLVTLFLGIPLLLIGLLLALKNSLKGRLLLTGTLGYFLYTYVSYVFLWMYNPMFIVYVVLMSASFFAFVLTISAIDKEKLPAAFKAELPVKFLGGFQIFLAFALFMMWMGKIIPTITEGDVPAGLEHYTTLVIQALDLGFVVPIAFISGVFLIKRQPIGYLLSSIVIMKGFTMGVAISAMILGQYLAGVSMGAIELIIFPLISVVICYCFYVLLINIKEDATL